MTLLDRILGRGDASIPPDPVAEPVLADSSWFSNFFFVSADNFLHGLNDWFGKSASSLVRLETAQDNYTLAADDGSLLSVIELKGSKVLVGEEEFNSIMERLAFAFTSRMRKGGHSLQVVFQYDPEEAAYEIHEMMRPSRITASNLGLQVDDMLDDWEGNLAGYCASEHVYLTLWTRPTVLPPVEMANGKKEMVNRVAASPKCRGCQVIDRGIRQIEDDHRAFVETVLTGCDGVGLMAGKMDVHEILWMQRRVIDRGLTGRGWRALLPGDPLPKCFPDPGQDDLSGVLYPSIGSQLFPRNPLDVTSNIVRVGNSWHASMAVTLPPQTPKPFNRLFSDMLGRKIPYRASFQLDGDGLTGLALKNLLASLLYYVSSNNKKYEHARQALAEIDLAGHAIIKLRMAFATSLHDELDPKVAIRTLEERISLVASNVQSWGSAECRPVPGDPVLGLTATLPALTLGNPGVDAGFPLRDAMTMLPVTRPASVWNRGNVPFRTRDGKLMPYQMLSSKQAAWVDIGVSPMGGGKSVLLNTLNFSFCIQEGLARLPWLSVIDIGPSSSGVVALIRASLPEHLKWMAQYHRLKMDDAYAINPFDLPLGFHRPTPLHKSFLVNLLSLFATELNADGPQDGIPGIARASIEAVYDEYSPERSPKPYVPRVDDEVDTLIANLGLHLDKKTSWWEIADDLFDAGHLHEAMRAQRFAVPLLADVASMARRHMVTGIFKHLTPGQEAITEFFWRSCVDAIASYPILKMPTRFDIGDAQIVSLDLDEVAPRGGAEADRQTAVMYMLARHVLASRFFLMPTDVAYAEDRYKKWHETRIDNIRQDPKRVCYDEVHRVMRNSSVSKQVVGDIETISRESRKWNLSLGLYSQSIEDYPEIIVELATSIYILGVGTVRMAENLRDRFGLNDASFRAIQNLGKPGKAGANFVALFKTSEGTSIQLLSNTVGLQALWAFSTTTEDVAVRNKLYALIGVPETLRRLADRYPGGVKDEVEYRKQNVKARGDLDDAVDVAAEIVREMMNYRP